MIKITCWIGVVATRWRLPRWTRCDAARNGECEEVSAPQPAALAVSSNKTPNCQRTFIKSAFAVNGREPRCLVVPHNVLRFWAATAGSILQDPKRRQFGSGELFEGARFLRVVKGVVARIVGARIAVGQRSKAERALHKFQNAGRFILNVGHVIPFRVW